MISNRYTTREGITVTSISKGREHYTVRRPKMATSTYPYECKFGDNYYTLSAKVFNDDKYWWILADLNLPQKGFDLRVGQIIKLPNGIVQGIGEAQKIL